MAGVEPALIQCCQVTAITHLVNITKIWNGDLGGARIRGCDDVTSKIADQTPNCGPNAESM